MRDREALAGLMTVGIFVLWTLVGVMLLLGAIMMSGAWR